MTHIPDAFLIFSFLLMLVIYSEKFLRWGFTAHPLKSRNSTKNVQSLVRLLCTSVRIIPINICFKCLLELSHLIFLKVILYIELSYMWTMHDLKMCLRYVNIFLLKADNRDTLFNWNMWVFNMTVAFVWGVKRQGKGCWG